MYAHGRHRNLVFFLVLAAVWGSAFAFIRAGLEHFPPILFAAIRYDVAGLVMLGYAVWKLDDPIPRTRGQLTLVAIGSVFLIAGYHALLFVGQTHPLVTSAAASVIVSLNPILTSGFARGFLPDERLTILGVVGMVLGLVGVVVIANPDPGNLLAGGVAAKLLVFGAAAAFAFGAVLSRWVDGELPIESMEAWSMLGGAALMHVLAVGLGERVADIQWTLEAVGSLAYLSLVASAFGFLVYFDLLDRLGPVEINLVSYVAPVFAALTGWAWLNEELRASTVAGFLVIFSGFALLKRQALADELARWRA